ncbi:MAG TPA: nucleotidyltransferase family protein [Vicinamibacterales bacterium]|nr:nucleotidyltransferase family protein [Vicinamibacterales bacterium]
MTAPPPIAALLARGREGAPWDGTADEAFVAAACRQNLGPLVYRALHRTGAWERQPESARARLTQSAAEAALIDRIRLDADRAVIAALIDEGIEPLLFKGAALAHLRYADSWLRPRADTDLLIRHGDRDAAARVFERRGFVRAAHPAGSHVTHQFTYTSIAHGIGAQYDVHWKIADPQAFADVVTYNELTRDAVPVDALGPGARGISDVHALIVACTHRVAHHYDTDDLLFLHDIDVLARCLDCHGWPAVVRLATEKRVRAVCARGLGLATERLGTPVPADVMGALSAPADEPTAKYLKRGLRRVDILRSDLASLRWSGRARLLREHLLPSPAYMRASYGRSSPLLLPALYLHRIARGAFRWLRPLNDRESSANHA